MRFESGEIAGEAIQELMARTSKRESYLATRAE